MASKSARVDDDAGKGWEDDSVDLIEGSGAGAWERLGTGGGGIVFLSAAADPFEA